MQKKFQELGAELHNATTMARQGRVHLTGAVSEFKLSGLYAWKIVTGDDAKYILCGFNLGFARGNLRSMDWAKIKREKVFQKYGFVLSNIVVFVIITSHYAFACLTCGSPNVFP